MLKGKWGEVYLYTFHFVIISIKSGYLSRIIANSGIVSIKQERIIANSGKDFANKKARISNVLLIFVVEFASSIKTYS